MPTCASCSASNADDSQFCARCGAALAREAVVALEETDFLTDRADVLTDFADVLLVAGRASEAADAPELALSLYELKGDVVTPPRIRAAIAAIRPTDGIR